MTIKLQTQTRTPKREGRADEPQEDTLEGARHPAPHGPCGT